MTRIRPYVDADLPAFQALRAAALAAKPDVWMPDPDQDTEHRRHCLVAEVDDAVVGYGWMDWWTEDDGTRMLLLLGHVDPAWRGRGVGQALLSAQEDAAMPYARSLPGSDPIMFGANADDDQPDARRLLRRCGFTVAYTYVELELDLTATPTVAVPLPAGFVERPIVEADHVVIHAAVKESFASLTGHVERTFEDFQRDAAAGSGLWCVAWDGDEVAGAVINERVDDRTVNTAWLAVREPWRRRGLASAMVRIGLVRSAESGVTTATVATIEENVNRTVELYEQVGYRVSKRMPRFRKPAMQPQVDLRSTSSKDR